MVTLDREDAVPLAILLALVFSLGAHLVLYLVLQPQVVFIDGSLRPQGPQRYTVVVDAVGDGEASGEPAGDAAEVDREPQEATAVAPVPRVRTTRPVERQVATAEAESEVTVPEAAEPETETVEPEPEAEETEDPITEILPSQLADRMLIEELTRRSRLSGFGGSGGGAGTGTGEGSGGSGCEDPILGTWRGRRYDPGLQRHVIFTLRVTARHGTRLEGRIINRSWNGGRSQRSPPRCGPGVSDHTVTMPARGRLSGNSFRFDALSHRRTNHCIEFGFWAYNLDHFTGTLSGDTLRVVNNDGGHELNSPYTFERISCD